MFMERLDQSRDLIRESRKTMMETEDVGVSALQDLSRHRQTLLHSHSKLDGVDEDELSRLSLSSFVVLGVISHTAAKKLSVCLNTLYCCGEKASAIADADTIVNGSTASEA
ncbi:hypothetical protein DY000_02030204 [Brassica cretica]|uniref:Uncharacterized protein n=1 Tax=Brassica cretica TaxID=69181 RepID=A0ABQ7DWF0_BRACR|nr:hypothetical protein DY000_02030204 [Brassica cretica]